MNKFGAWCVAELPAVLWPKGNPQSSHRLHTFFMVYGSETILLDDLDYGAPRIRAYDELGAEASHEDAMD